MAPGPFSWSAVAPLNFQALIKQPMGMEQRQHRPARAVSFHHPAPLKIPAAVATEAGDAAQGGAVHQIRLPKRVLHDQVSGRDIDDDQPAPSEAVLP